MMFKLLNIWVITKLHTSATVSTEILSDFTPVVKMMTPESCNMYLKVDITLLLFKTLLKFILEYLI